MADISKCSSSDCSHYTKCYRATVESGYIQSFTNFKENKLCDVHNEFILFKRGENENGKSNNNLQIEQ